MDDSVRLEDFGYRALLDHYHEAIPNVRRKTTAIPGMPGRWDFGSELESKPFEIPIQALSDSSLSLQQKQNELVAFLMDEYGRPRNIKFVFDYEPDKFYTVKIDGAVAPVLRAHILSNKTLPFIAHDPFKYASANEYDPDEDYKYDEDYSYDVGLMYDNPKSFEWKYERHYSGINNYSPLVTDFIIEIQGTVKNGSITNLNNNEKLTLPNINNGKLIIDGKRFAIIRNGEAILEGSNYNFFHIQPGEVGFLFEGDNPNATVTYKWLHKFN